jgi:hypothetical protein
LVPNTSPSLQTTLAVEADEQSLLEEQTLNIEYYLTYQQELEDLTVSKRRAEFRSKE